jgi:hypothetical protein
MGFELVNGFIDQLQVVLQYNTIAISALYSSLLHTLVSITVSTSRFLATDFNTGTITVLLNYTLQVLHIQSSLHSQTFDSALSQLILFFTASRTELNLI